MRPISVAIGDVYKCWPVKNCSDIKLSEAGFFFEFTQPAYATCFMSFNMSAWGGPLQRLVFNEQGWLISQSLELALIRWSGTYRGVTAVWLRWATLQGQILPTGRELAERERLRAEQEHQRAEKLAKKLRSLGVDLDDNI